MILPYARALAAYEKALNEFRAILAERRAQDDGSTRRDSRGPYVTKATVDENAPSASADMLAQHCGGLLRSGRRRQDDQQSAGTSGATAEQQ